MVKLFAARDLLLDFGVATMSAISDLKTKKCSMVNSPIDMLLDSMAHQLLAGNRRMWVARQWL